MKRMPRALMWFYLIVGYVTLQFVWWGYHLVNLSDQVYSDAKATKRFWMIIGEGGVFFILLVIAIFQLKKSIRKEIELGEQQKNFLLSTTHELKTPISVIKLYLQTLQRHDLDAVKRKEALEKALSENERLNAMIENMLIAARMQQHVDAPPKSKFKIAPVIDTSLEQLRLKYPGREISLELNRDVELTTNQNALETIVSNLVDNALKYSQDPVRVSFDENSRTLEVKDLGRGIVNKREVLKLFVREEKEETRNTKGTGLGLYIVNNLCQAIGAQLSIENNSNQGTLIKVKFN